MVILKRENLVASGYINDTINGVTRRNFKKDEPVYLYGKYTQIYIPENYDFEGFFKAMFSWKEIIHNHKYINNYDYNKAVYLMSEFKLLENGFLILKKDESFGSPIATLFYE